MTTSLFIKTMSGALAPVHDAGRDALRTMKSGDYVMVTLKRPRNLQHHRKLFALLDLIFQNQTRYKSVEELLDAIKVYCGHCEVMILRDGTEVRRPQSISFAKMDQAAFEKFYDAVVNVVVTEIIPGLNRSDLERELLDFVGTDARTLAANTEAA